MSWLVSSKTSIHTIMSVYYLYLHIL